MINFPVNLCQKQHQCLHVSPLLWYHELRSPLLWDQSLFYCSIKLYSIVALKFPLLCYQNLLYCVIQFPSIVGSKSPLLWDQSLFYCGIKISSIVGSKSSSVATILWPRQTVRSSCWSPMFNGIRPEPTNKRFNSEYLQIIFLSY